MAFNNEAPFQVRKHIQLLGGVRVASIAGNDTLTIASSTYQILDGGGSDYDVILPAEDDGIYFWIRNDGATNNLVVKNDAAATIKSLTPGLAALVVCDGTNWKVVISA